nr:TRAP transporter large permease [Halalkalibacter oceani]
MFVSLAIFFTISVPIAVALGFSSLIVMNINGMPMLMLPLKAYESLNSFTLLAIPFFILAGHIMQSGGISKRLINLANVLVGWIRGGLGAVAVLTSMIFATMSGSSSATTAAIGSTLIPAMEKKGYPKRFAAATCASSGELGAIIPPSINMIMYGLVANVSIGNLFLAGFIPGILVGLSLIVTIIVIARVRDFDAVTKISKSEWLKEFVKALADSFLALLMPLIILGGIFLGWFTPTEASVIAVVYGFIVSFVFYKELKFKDILPILSKSARSSAIILIIVAFASIFGYILTTAQVPHLLGETITNFTTNPIVFLLLANLLLLVTGMFIEGIAAIVILVPILAPMASTFGIDPIHFGIVMIVNLAIGMVTPPVGVNLYVACQIANLRIDQIIRPVLLFLGVLIVDLLIITYIPFLSTWLPSLAN